MVEYTRVHAIKLEPEFIQGILVTLLPTKRNMHERNSLPFKQWEELILAQLVQGHHIVKSQWDQVSEDLLSEPYAVI